MNNYQVADFIIRIKNAALARRRKVMLPYSRMNHEIAKVLVKEKFLSGVSSQDVDGKKMLMVEVQFDPRDPMLKEVVIVSKPSLRVYVRGSDILQRERKGARTTILSTNQGIMTGKSAQKKGIGGELLFEVA